SIAELDEKSHIHGDLIIKIKNKRVPRMGFNGMDDVCFSIWITEFEKMIDLFNEKENSKYKYDEGEQGQPAFLFEKEEDNIYLSINDSEMFDGKGEKDWQKVNFSYDNFLKEYNQFRNKFLDDLENADTEIKEQWIRMHIPIVLKYLPE